MCVSSNWVKSIFSFLFTSHWASWPMTWPLEGPPQWLFSSWVYSCNFLAPLLALYIKPISQCIGIKYIQPPARTGLTACNIRLFCSWSTVTVTRRWSLTLGPEPRACHSEALRESVFPSPPKPDWIDVEIFFIFRVREILLWCLWALNNLQQLTEL